MDRILRLIVLLLLAIAPSAPAQQALISMRSTTAC